MTIKKLLSPCLRSPRIFFFAGFVAFVFAVVLTLLFLLSAFIPVPRSRLSPAPVVSLEIRDRNGKLLREVLSDEGGRCRWVELEDVSPHLIKATIAAEDRRFPFHSGLNVLAVVRASVQNLRSGRVVSGASTISQQLARNIWPGPRTVGSKFREAWYALRLERTLSKEEILVQYLNRIFYGNQAYGAEAASRLYFGKPCSELSLAESAFLAGLPRAPSLFNPYRSDEARDASKGRQRAILHRMAKLGFCTEEEMTRALGEEPRIVPAEVAFLAPHFCDWVLGRIPQERRREISFIQTTLDFALQEKIEAMLCKYLDSLSSRGITNGAVVVLDNATDEVLSLVGSKNFFDEARAGQVNGALARRQPGSTLKPFTYALAIEKGLTATSIVEDSPSAFPTDTGAYIPLNFDRKYHGPMSLRAALACSYNIPAVSLLEKIGPDLLYRRLKALGFESLEESPGYYGLGLTLGNGEVTLLELVRAYAALARQGMYRPEKAVLAVVAKTDKSGALSKKIEREKERKKEKQKESQSPSLGSRRIFSDQVAYIITSILSDRDARVPSFGYVTPLSFPFPVAAKTGTSKDFRDNWTVGYTSRYTVGVWVGNFDGKPMQSVSGITGCGPLFRDIMFLLNRKEGWAAFEEPEGIVRQSVCPESGELPMEFCPGAVEEIFIAGTEPRAACSRHSGAPLSDVTSHILAREPWYGSTTAANFSSSTALSPTQTFQVEITFPGDGDVFKIDPVLRLEHQRIKLRAAVFLTALAGDGVVEWVINGQKTGESSSQPFVFFWNLKPGTYTIKAKFVCGTETCESRPVRIQVLN
ncbi:MAG: penicillin-binding protein 1C [Clostridiales bacterium]|nr:penicillin-binding protein 1C [Clostridiales bacterium]